MDEIPLPISATSTSFDRDATVKMVARYVGSLWLEIDTISETQNTRIAEHLTDMVFLQTSKDMYSMTKELDAIINELEETRKRLKDAEITIAKIGS